MGNVLNCHAVIENNPQRAYFAISNTIARVTICNDTCMSHFLPSHPPLSTLHTSLHPSPPSSSSLSVYWTQRWLLSIMLAYSTLCCFRNVQLRLLTNRIEKIFIMFISGDCYYLWYSSCCRNRFQKFLGNLRGKKAEILKWRNCVLSLNANIIDVIYSLNVVNFPEICPLGITVSKQQSANICEYLPLGV